MQWYLAVLRKYTMFDGRSHRPEFWWFTLWSLIITMVLTVVDAALDLGNDSGRAADLDLRAARPDPEPRRRGRAASTTSSAPAGGS